MKDCSGADGLDKRDTGDRKTDCIRDCCYCLGKIWWCRGQEGRIYAGETQRRVEGQVIGWMNAWDRSRSSGEVPGFWHDKYVGGDGITEIGSQERSGWEGLMMVTLGVYSVWGILIWGHLWGMQVDIDLVLRFIENRGRRVTINPVRMEFPRERGGVGGNPMEHQTWRE